MNLAETIYQRCLNLPEPLAREVLDFILFLEQRYAKDKLKPSAQNDNTETFLAALSGSLSDDSPDDINDSDLGIN